MSLIELYVGFRVFLGSVVSGVLGGYVVPTFAADFRVFKSMITHIFATIGLQTTHMSGHLTGIGIHVPQMCIEVGFSAGTGHEVVSVLQRFVGHRPITNAQGFARPLHV